MLRQDAEFKALLFSLFMFNAIICERRKFGSLGFNIPYDFTTGDCNICVSQLNMFLLEYAPQVPLKVSPSVTNQIVTMVFYRTICSGQPLGL